MLKAFGDPIGARHCKSRIAHEVELKIMTALRARKDGLVGFEVVQVLATMFEIVQVVVQSVALQAVDHRPTAVRTCERQEFFVTTAVEQVSVQVFVFNKLTHRDRITPRNSLQFFESTAPTRHDAYVRHSAVLPNSRA